MTAQLVAGGCPACICNPGLCATDETGEHCATTGCAACLDGCPFDEHNMTVWAPVSPHTETENR